MRHHTVLATLALTAGLSAIAVAQQPARPGAPAPGSPRATQPLDLEGWWVSVVTEDWRWRMMTPPKGDAPGVPLSLEGRKVADAWDLARDNSAGRQCMAYGAGGIMRIPTRIHVTWTDDYTLRFDFDAGKQTRTLQFPRNVTAPLPANGAARPHGYSWASWQTRTTGSPILNEETPPNRGGGGQGPELDRVEGINRAAKGSLKVVTTGMTSGYYRKNGLSYSENARLTEYFDRHDDFGEQWFTVMSVLEDPRYLVSPFVTTTSFKREKDGSKFSPGPCETLPPTAPASRGEEVGSVPN
jgi:hypothetical protein